MIDLSPKRGCGSKRVNNNILSNLPWSPVTALVFIIRQSGCLSKLECRGAVSEGVRARGQLETTTLRYSSSLSTVSASRVGPVARYKMPLGTDGILQRGCVQSIAGFVATVPV